MGIFFVGVPHRPYIHDHGALLAYMMIAYLLTNSKLTEPISENAADSSLTRPDILGCDARESRTVSLDSARFDGPLGLESVAFSDRPILPVAFARPTKRWCCGVTGPRPRARTFRLLVDPEISVPHKPPIFELILK
jgi:hypothetical protein